jgi:hypothetical protein
VPGVWPVRAVQAVAEERFARKGRQGFEIDIAMADEAPNDGDILRMMVATDNHLGYMETDPVRKEDSFVAFEEIFKVAKDHGVDCVLLGGDLFHENKPSRCVPPPIPNSHHAASYPTHDR